jgi:NADH-quinone oxidoreductase subunit J
MVTIFFVAAAVAIVSTFLVITHLDAVHALLYLVISLLSVALIFYLLGAPFVAALEVIIYAGAIMVLFIFVVMVLNLGPLTREQENRWLKPGMWLGPVILSGILAIELVYVLAGSGAKSPGLSAVGPQEVSRSLFGPYLIAVELASILLMAGLIGAYHIGREWKGKVRNQ